jgi:hypothetical protein
MSETNEANPVTTTTAHSPIEKLWMFYESTVFHAVVHVRVECEPDEAVPALGPCWKVSACARSGEEDVVLSFAYGGTVELAVDNLLRDLRDKGHDVDRAATRAMAAQRSRSAWALAPAARAARTDALI